ncbi:MAG: pentapeptide repeat-containing protein [Robiginitomaculum sp.]|nr:pentapeptide repeat-containing protein [Robiginitomaculum sp.]
MKIQLPIKRAALCLSAIGFLWSSSALSQTSGATPVSTSVHLSGSCAECDLSRRVMPGMSLQGANFAGSDFSHSNLAGANFNHANLDHASFYKAYLMGVKGNKVNMNRAVLRGSTLSELNLVSSNFILADLHKADLTGGNFTNSDFTKARLKSTDAMNAVFINANFTKAKLDRGDFTGSDFSGAKFINTKFGDAEVKDANFVGANFSGADMVELSGLSQSQLDGACGSKETQLPEGFSLKVCSPEVLTLEAELKPDPIALTDRVAPQAPPTLMRPMIATRISRRGTMLSIRSTELDEIMRGINGALGDLPMNSPTRAKLEKSRRKLEAVQAKANR